MPNCDKTIKKYKIHTVAHVSLATHTFALSYKYSYALATLTNTKFTNNN